MAYTKEQREANALKAQQQGLPPPVDQDDPAESARPPVQLKRPAADLLAHLRGTGTPDNILKGLALPPMATTEEAHNALAASPLVSEGTLRKCCQWLGIDYKSKAASEHPEADNERLREENEALRERLDKTRAEKVGLQSQNDYLREQLKDRNRDRDIRRAGIRDLEPQSVEG